MPGNGGRRRNMTGGELIGEVLAKEGQACRCKLRLQP